MLTSRVLIGRVQSQVLLIAARRQEAEAGVPMQANPAMQTLRCFNSNMTRQSRN